MILEQWCFCERWLCICLPKRARHHTSLSWLLNLVTELVGQLIQVILLDSDGLHHLPHHIRVQLMQQRHVSLDLVADTLHSFLLRRSGSLEVFHRLTKLADVSGLSREFVDINVISYCVITRLWNLASSLRWLFFLIEFWALGGMHLSGLLLTWGQSVKGGRIVVSFGSSGGTAQYRLSVWVRGSGWCRRASPVYDCCVRALLLLTIHYFFQINY